MTATIIDGRKIADALEAHVAAEAQELDAGGIRRGLATLAVGDDYGSRAYVRRLKQLTSRLAIPHQAITLPADSTEGTVREVVARLNADPAVSGILILRPLPPHLDEARIFPELSPLKDIESVHPDNVGLLAVGRPRYVPSTPASAFHVLDKWLDEAGEDRAEFYHRSLIVVVGRSDNVGKPAVALAYDRQAAVESIDIWASRTGRLGWHTRRADVLIVAAGVPGLIRPEHIKEGAVVLDVGINQLTDPGSGRTCMTGDVDFDGVAQRARAITPVPGGVGPVTDVWLVRNTVSAARSSLSLDPALQR
ncbi:methylenetetrahydrofolate dehydrogenase (NADP+)/methenyltetrahydrofolate cyclohydrolase [Streptomyces sp. B3I7]|uniref:bifunctional 5,10-methylenetetrahydrofolate dehydrogenase/5,10-methenyltetrahydrofolate cyclohydrolase n=1 Tax=Streptomyces sp. B3I7 TaxID=3042269 RepID=UPI00278422F2|nr:tetrahydrofolate dehydrogenase/cyclohydrolase catalytic domain-containing protein [Streptomyces sp. B3I7]MDQ0808508.1 methylenetetrahydrofolate dehydrogenase (NADP+)/methenyltetrahydrofolate cyclohydrolase [Streptomyces sp. B3I7]